MTDATTSAAAPPKKRFGFKKAAWQEAPKTEAEDMFSHANEFSNIVAEETRRKNDQKKKAGLEPKRKLSEEREPKRRKVSASQDEEVPCSRTRSSPKGRRLASKGHGSVSDTPTARYDSLTQSASRSDGAARKSEVVDLGSDSEEEDVIAHAASPIPRAIPIHSRPDSRRGSSEEVEEVDSPHTAALKAQARETAAAKAAQKEPTPAAYTRSQTPTPAAPVAVVQLLIDSWIPDTNPLLVKIKSDSTLKKPKDAWCGKQGFAPEETSKVFITWRRNRIYDYTRIQRLGIQIENGFVTIKDDPTIYDDKNLPKIHVEAWTEEVWKKQGELEALEAAKARNEIIEVEEPEPEPEPEEKGTRVRLFLKAKGKKDYKIVVRSTTTIEHLTNAYKQNMGIPQEQSVTLMFDGERLKTIDTIADTEIEDMDAIEVHLK
ncbi:hypothetical protein BU23DRAFT_575202 [Bimuria novae-zelandiae CBS 107.79]|uniref:Ubiquitin-like domain-containing protein n=1 Tax=Bimuria novae-zelandiae CBS 107.79 TaxID=1447943 RepID=A0A6A5UMF9_9PLEO|nr:hypothetical protein BU23DRAFT_575202 [Bimuria novae-zelandiae CBS 107.79]